jgi:uncharacterized RmlC-like cupin family protein
MRPTKLVLLALVSIGLSRLTTAEDLPKGVTLVPLPEMKWVKASTGRETAMMLGNLDHPGAYLQLVKWPANNKALAHKHSDDRYGIVISGVHYLGYGDKFDESKLHAHPAGTYFTEPANTPHFGMTKGEGAVLYFYGIGPSKNIPLE